LQFSFVLYYAIACALHNDSLVFGAQIRGYSYTVYGVNIALDAMFTVSMMILLHKEKSVFSSTQDMVNRLSLIIINTGLATTTICLLAIILSVSLPAAVLGYAVPFYGLTPLYCISILANLNSRGYVRGAGRSHAGSAATDSEPVGLSILQFNSNRYANTQGSRDVIGRKDTDINIGMRMSEGDDV